MKIYQINREAGNGLQRYNDLMKVDSFLFIAIEKIFDGWMDDEAIERIYQRAKECRQYMNTEFFKIAA